MSINDLNIRTILRGWGDSSVGYGDPADRGTNPVTPITFSYAAIHLPTVYNLQRQQRPVSLIPCLYGVGDLLLI